MRLLRRFLCVAIAALAITVVAQAQDMQEGRLFRFPDVYKDKIVFSYAGDLWLVPTSGALPDASPPIRASSSSRNSRPTAHGSPSPANTTAIPTSTSFPPKAASPSN